MSSPTSAFQLLGNMFSLPVKGSTADIPLPTAASVGTQLASSAPAVGFSELWIAMSATGQEVALDEQKVRQNLVMDAADNGTGLPPETTEQQLKKLDRLLQDKHDNENDLIESAVKLLKMSLQQHAVATESKEQDGIVTPVGEHVTDSEALQYLQTQVEVDRTGLPDKHLLMSESSNHKLIEYLEKKLDAKETQYASYTQPALPDVLSIKEVSDAVQLARQFREELDAAGRAQMDQAVDDVEVENKAPLMASSINTLISYLEKLQNTLESRPPINSSVSAPVIAENLSKQDIAEHQQSLRAVFESLEVAYQSQLDQGVDAAELENKAPLTASSINTLIGYLEQLQNTLESGPPINSSVSAPVIAENLSKQEIEEHQQSLRAVIESLELAYQSQLDQGVDAAEVESKAPLTASSVNTLIGYLEQLQNTLESGSSINSSESAPAIAENLSKQDIAEHKQSLRAVIESLELAYQSQLDHGVDAAELENKAPLTASSVNTLISYLEQLQNTLESGSPINPSESAQVIAENLSKQEIAEHQQSLRAVIESLELAYQSQLDQGVYAVEVENKAPLTASSINALISYLEQLQNTLESQPSLISNAPDPVVNKSLTKDELRAVEQLVREMWADLTSSGQLSADKELSAKPGAAYVNTTAEPDIVINSLVRYLEQRLSALESPQHASVQPVLSATLSSEDRAEAARMIQQLWSELEASRLAQARFDKGVMTASPVSAERPVIAPEQVFPSLSKEPKGTDFGDKGAWVSTAPAPAPAPAPMRTGLEGVVHDGRPVSLDQLGSENLKAPLAEERALMASKPVEVSTEAQRNAAPVSQPIQSAQLSVQQPQNAPDTLMQKMLNPAWSKALGQRAVMMAQQGPRVAEVRLDPPELGSLRIRVQIHGSDQVSLTFTAPSAAVREVLEQSMPRLREMFAEQGLNLTDTSVGDQSAQERAEKEQREAVAKGFSNSMGDDLGDAPASRTGARKIGLIDYYA